jgi:hypothetical protein
MTTKISVLCDVTPCSLVAAGTCKSLFIYVGLLVTSENATIFCSCRLLDTQFCHVGIVCALEIDEAGVSREVDLC